MELNCVEVKFENCVFLRMSMCHLFPKCFSPMEIFVIVSLYLVYLNLLEANHFIQSFDFHANSQNICFFLSGDVWQFKPEMSLCIKVLGGMMSL